MLWAASHDMYDTVIRSTSHDMCDTVTRSTSHDMYDTVFRRLERELRKDTTDFLWRIDEDDALALTAHEEALKAEAEGDVSYSIYLVAPCKIDPCLLQMLYATAYKAIRARQLAGLKELRESPHVGPANTDPFRAGQKRQYLICIWPHPPGTICSHCGNRG